MKRCWLHLVLRPPALTLDWAIGHGSFARWSNHLPILMISMLCSRKKIFIFVTYDCKNHIKKIIQVKALLKGEY